MLIDIICGWIVPFYLYIGLFTLLFGIFKEELTDFGWKQTAQYTFAWPVVWIMMFLLKYKERGNRKHIINNKYISLISDYFDERMATPHWYDHIWLIPLLIVYGIIWATKCGILSTYYKIKLKMIHKR
ncbi:hypothetical protein [Paenibacillus sp. FSL H3-0286]|uniref:hypothetical protein n=1 Tax=Paenibacillus sp. FSL H3-0286 TaxID=2921427 RepID=UPI003251BFDA